MCVCVCVRVSLFILCCAHALSLTVKQFKFLFCDDATNNNNNNCDYNNNNNTNFWPVMSSCVWCHLAVAIQMKRLGNSKPQIGAKSSVCRGASTHASSTRTHIVYTHALTQQQSSGRARKIKTFILSTTQAICLSRVYFSPCQRQIVSNVVTKKAATPDAQTRPYVSSKHFVLNASTKW